jgi:cell wall-associated NlpC family hydrolase
MPKLPRLELCAPLLLLACATATATAIATPATAAAPAMTTLAVATVPSGRPAPKRAPARTPPPAPASPLRDRVVERATSAVGAPTLRAFTREVSDDCTGFVRWTTLASGEELVAGSAANMMAIASRARAMRRSGPPLPGDLVFFRDTYDRNRDRRRGDGITHIGVVERVEPDGTVVFVHRAGSGVKQSRLNLRHPSEQRAGDGRTLNDYIRRASGKRRARLTGEQFAGFANLDQLYRSRTGAPVALGRESPRP